MAIYILLSRLSQQGVATLKSNPGRLLEVNRDVEELGARVLHQWATLGEYDFVNVIEAPDVETVPKVSVALAARGSTRIQTLPAREIEQFLATLSHYDGLSTAPVPSTTSSRARPSDRRVRSSARRP